MAFLKLFPAMVSELSREKASNIREECEACQIFSDEWE